ELERELKAQQVEQRFVEVTKELENLAFESADLEQPAQELGLTVKTTEPFGREGGEGIAANRQVLQAAFSDEVLMDRANSSVIELDPNTVVAVRVKQHVEPEVQAFETVREGIVGQLQRSKAAEQARSEGERLLTTLREGGQVEQQWRSTEAATRGQDGVEPVVLQAVFRMPKPEGDSSTFAGVTLASGDYVVIRLDGVSEPEGELSAEEKLNYRRFLASRSGQQDFAAYREQLHAEAKIEKFYRPP